MSEAAEEALRMALRQAATRHAEKHPKSRQAFERAQAAMPGGNTRSVLFYEPFPLTIASGSGCRVRDLDGLQYLDCVGEYSAGLYGHGNREIRAAIDRALDDGLVLGGPNRYEALLAETVCARFPSIEQVRFCNSGTEANLLAAATARAVTGRDRIVVFDGAYHGGMMTFPSGGNALNVPFVWDVLPYNDAQALCDLLSRKGDEVAAIFAEPILGAAGNIPGEPAFLQEVERQARACGALFVLDEVKTSRCGPGGMQAKLGLSPDLTTIGKYLGGGLTLAAFGGRARIMGRFDPRRPDGIRHAGTFNNNPVALAAGLAGLTRVFTDERARSFDAAGERLRKRIAEAMAARGLPVTVTGCGTFFSLHVGPTPPRSAAEVSAATRALRPLLLLDSIDDGVVLASRGDIYLSLPMAEREHELLADSLLAFVERRRELIEGLAEADDAMRRGGVGNNTGTLHDA